MSKAPPDSRENASARASRLAISSLSRTGAAPASRLMRDSSESSLCGLIARSMRCISAITESIAAVPAAASSLQSSTVIAVPMIASSRLRQPASPARASRPGATPRGPSWALDMPNIRVAMLAKKRWLQKKRDAGLTQVIKGCLRSYAEHVPETSPHEGGRRPSKFVSNAIQTLRRVPRRP